MPSQNNDHSRDVDRLLFEAQAHAMLGVARDEMHANFAELHVYGPKSPGIGLVDMRPLIQHFDCLGIAATWVRGGSSADQDPVDAAERRISHYPPLM